MDFMINLIYNMPDALAVLQQSYYVHFQYQYH